MLEATFFFVFSRFQKQRFGIFLFSAFFVGSKSNVSAVFWLRFRMVWAYIPFFLMGSNSDVSAFFRLRFRNGLGTKPAGVLPFRMRVPNTFFLSLAWWLAGFFFVFSRVQKQRFGSFLAAVSHGLGPISFSGWSIPETCHPSPNHCFDRPHPILLSPLLGVGGMGGSPSIMIPITCRYMQKIYYMIYMYIYILYLQKSAESTINRPQPQQTWLQMAIN